LKKCWKNNLNIWCGDPQVSDVGPAGLPSQRAAPEGKNNLIHAIDKNSNSKNSRVQAISGFNYSSGYFCSLSSPQYRFYYIRRFWIISYLTEIFGE